MNIRTVVVATGLCVSLLTAGCASAVAGQAQIASGAVLPTTSQSAPSPFPDPSGGDSSGTSESSGTSDSDSSSSESTDGPTAVSTQETQNTGITENTPTGESSTEDSSTGLTSATSIPGLSKDCTAVLAGITAFSSVLQGAGSTGRISQATVDTALEQLPASGLPAQPQADITVLRTTVSGAAGKTLAQLGQTITDGKVVAALEDLSDWSKDNCS